MNNKTIIAFGFRGIRRILKNSQGVIHLSLRLRWITPSSICKILHILRKQNSIIADYVTLCVPAPPSPPVIKVM